MAKLTQVTLIDDLDGSEAQATVQFGVGSGLWEIDLNESHRQELFASLSKFIAAATPLGAYRTTRDRHTTMHGEPPRRGGHGAAEAEIAGRSREIRAWAAATGIYVPSRGRLPQRLIDHFEQERNAAIH